jgi:hypothetical protein
VLCECFKSRLRTDLTCKEELDVVLPVDNLCTLASTLRATLAMSVFVPAEVLPEEGLPQLLVLLDQPAPPSAHLPRTLARAVPAKWQ